MDRDERKSELDASLRRIISLLSGANDDEILLLLGDGILGDFLNAIVEPRVPGQSNPYEYLLANKNALQLLAHLRLAITRNYSIEAIADEQTIFVSPTEFQWYPDGVMFVQGKERFQGLIGLYQAGEVKFGIAARAAQAGDALGRDDIIFLEPEEARRRSEEASVPRTPQGLDQALVVLEEMLAEQPPESEWQDYFRSRPWILGLEYTQVESHTALDDARIPDFTAVRAHDAARDIIEIKPPTMVLFKQDGGFRAELHKAWDQAERYLDFARRESDYLRREKGLNFENPFCYLIAGHNLTRQQLKTVRRKERMNPAIRFRTFNDIEAMARNTVEIIKRLKNDQLQGAGRDK